ncbi:hypothetical protein [Streptomyces gardneri]|uniref:hypothetical protein n=1 Tax=Streptomyces gardneri TaxID=66892 RepID=UPI0035D78DC2
MYEPEIGVLLDAFVEVDGLWLSLFFLHADGMTQLVSRRVAGAFVLLQQCGGAAMASSFR